jgi:uncharacterized membrane protein
MTHVILLCIIYLILVQRGVVQYVVGALLRELERVFSRFAALGAPRARARYTPLRFVLVRLSETTVFLMISLLLLVVNGRNKTDVQCQAH